VRIFPAGTPEGDLIRSNVPTTTAAPPRAAKDGGGAPVEAEAKG